MLNKIWLDTFFILDKSFHMQLLSSIAKQFEAKPLNFQVLEYKSN